MKSLVYLPCLLLVACTAPLPDTPSAPPAWVHASTGGTALQSNWWQAYGDPSLALLIAQAWAQNPDLTSALAKTKAARIDRQEALAMLFPTAGAGIGFVTGYEKNMATDGVRERLDPWQSEAMFSWELDVTGKNRARIRAAEAREAAAWARFQGVKLMLATEVAAARFESVLLGEVASLLREQAAAEKEAYTLTRSLADSGLTDSADLAEREADAQSFLRMAEDMDRMQKLAGLRLDRLTGGRAQAGGRPAYRVPSAPQRLPAEAFARRPDLIAAEAEVRAAFEIAYASRLDLLPSLSLTAGADGGQSSLRNRFQMWTASVGPRLEIPIWDPTRLAAVPRNRAEAEMAAADYRSTALTAIEEIEGGYVNFRSRVRQHASAERESASRRVAWTNAESRRKAGLISSIQATELRHAYYEARRNSIRLKIRVLNNHLRLIRALGG